MAGTRCLEDIPFAVERFLHGNACLGKVILAEGTNANTFKTTTNTVFFAVKGAIYTKAPADNLTFSSGHTAVGPSKTCIFAVCFNAAGTVSTVQGEILTTADIVAGTVDPPAVTDDSLCVVGYIKVATDGSTTFTPGSTDLGASGVTDTYYDVMIPPLRGVLG